MNPTPNSVPAEADPLLAALDKLYSGVVCDVLDSLGYRNQALSAHVRALTPVQRVAGRVFPARAQVVHEIPAEPYKLEIAAVDALVRGDVLVVDGQDDMHSAFWGELLTTACVYKGARGVVMTACTRDLWKLRDVGFPVFGIGCHPGDSKGRLDVVVLGEPIVISGVRTKRGDYILGDEDGVVIIPGEVAAEAIRLAQEKVAGENIARADLARGIPVAEVFRKHGIL